MIDRMWHTPDLELCGASYVLFHADIVDHQTVLADFTQALVLDINFLHDRMSNFVTQAN